MVRELDQLLSPRLYALVDGESRRPGSWLAGRSVTTSFIQRLPWGVRRVQLYLPLLPLAVEQLDLSGHGLVVSSSHLVAKGVLTAPDQLHVSYVHSPPRYAWDQMNVYLRRNALARGPLGPWIRWQLHQLRQWDQLSAQRVDVLVANSRFYGAAHLALLAASQCGGSSPCGGGALPLAAAPGRLLPVSGTPGGL